MAEVKGRQCVFCGQPGGSKEHALPTWLAEVMGVENEPVQPGLISDSRGVENQGNPRFAGALIAKSVCGKCNNGWMCDLEGQVRPILSELVDPDFAAFSREKLEPLQENLPLLSRWLMKTAVTMSLVAPRGTLGSIPDGASQWAYEDAIPSSCMLYAGWIENASFGKTLSRGFRTLNGGVFHENQIHEHSFDFRLQLNHLGLRFVNAPEAIWALTECRNTTGNLCIPRVLTPAGYFDSDCADSILFRDFFDFSKVCVLATGSLPDRLDPVEELKMAASLQSRLL